MQGCLDFYDYIAHYKSRNKSYMLKSVILTCKLYFLKLNSLDQRNNSPLQKILM